MSAPFPERFFARFFASEFAFEPLSAAQHALLDESGTPLTGNSDDCILIPLTTAQRVSGGSGITSFCALAADESSVEDAQALLELYLLTLTRDEDAYTVYNQTAVPEAMNDVTDTLTMMLAGIAAISLLVGGIGIMNIMLVSVSERTREIGIRKAIGAKRRHILGQFLLEACVLSIIGGALGVGVSLLGIELIDLIAGYSIGISWSVSLAAMSFCVVIGLIFGSYPAAKASAPLPSRRSGAGFRSPRIPPPKWASRVGSMKKPYRFTFI